MTYDQELTINNNDCEKPHKFFMFTQLFDVLYQANSLALTYSQYSVINFQTAYKMTLGLIILAYQSDWENPILVILLIFLNIWSENSKLK